jgi:large subunit ribosomal protein L1
MNIGQAVKEIKNGKFAYKTDKDGNLSITVGKVSFDADKLASNMQTVIDAIVKARPASVKGAYVTNAVVHTTMGPALKLAILG